MKQQSDEFEILIIADNPSADVVPTTFNKSWAEQKFCGFSQLDFCLEWVSWFDSPNVIVASLSLDVDSCDHLMERWAAHFKNLHVKTFQNCFSVNDILREVATRQLLTGDFIFIENISTFCSSNLPSQLPAFRSLRSQNKNNVLTLLYSPIECQERYVVGLQNFTNKLVVYNSKNERRSKISVSKNLFTMDTVFRSDISPCGIAICALELTDHFTGNYDFQTFDGIIQDILTNEEFLLQSIHVEVVSDVVAFGANDYASLLRAQSLLIKRNAYPLTFDNILPYFKDFDRLARNAGNNVYAPAGTECPAGASDSVFGKGAVVDKSAVIKEASFGTEARIGAGVTITNCIVGDSVSVGENCSIENSIVQSGVSIGSGAKVNMECIIGEGVSIPSGGVVVTGSVLHSVEPPNSMRKDHAENDSNWYVSCDQVNGYYVWNVMKKRRVLAAGERSSVSSASSSLANNMAELNQDDDGLDEPVDVVYQGNNAAFLSEVSETMQSTLKLGNHASKEQLEKMKLEINASKLAYNVSSDDLSKNIFHAFLNLSSSQAAILHSFKALSELFKEWSLLWRNYYKRDTSKVQLLHAIEEVATEDLQFLKVVPKFLQFLFDEADFLSEEVLTEWYESLPEKSSLSAPLKPLMEWIKNADEESSDEED